MNKAKKPKEKSLKNLFRSFKSKSGKHNKNRSMNEDLLEAASPTTDYDDASTTQQEDDEKADCNAILRFAIEVSGAASLFGFGYALAHIWSAISLPLVAGALWIFLHTPNDPIAPWTRHTLNVPGKLRFLLEVVLYAAAGYGMHFAFSYFGVIVFVAMVLLHVSLTTDRILWLLQN